MTDFSDMLSKAKAVQEKMKEAQDQIKKIEVEGESGGNLVKVILSGDYELKLIIISDAAKKENQDIINDLIIAAYNNARENLKKKSAGKLFFFACAADSELPFNSITLELLDAGRNRKKLNQIEKSAHSRGCSHTVFRSLLSRIFHKHFRTFLVLQILNWFLTINEE